MDNREKAKRVAAMLRHGMVHGSPHNPDDVERVTRVLRLKDHIVGEINTLLRLQDDLPRQAVIHLQEAIYLMDKEDIRLEEAALKEIQRANQIYQESMG